ncbi:hypothetical protein [Bogoriella caseilytica]|uniref:Uncharacterized protein n=1 Tax=Bogoriella caseilytica TaxID=56055 RepID=A0A3N2BF89_9MICO|nr:hypothetical protein [Bogoriella caseilytica]ROR73917.1 hypothetical protein EDD31_2312 [Bogoriella caseilytica]
MVVVAAVVIAVLIAAAPMLGSVTGGRISAAVCEMAGGSDCGGEPGVVGDPVTAGEPSSSSPAGSVDEDYDREDAGRDARDSRRDDQRREEPAPGPGPADPGGDSPTELGDPVPGESADWPEAPSWQPVDEGAGEYNSEDARARDHAVKFLAEGGAHALSGTWPDASRNLLHFLGNTGEPLDQDVDRILGDVPRLAGEYEQRVDFYGQTAIETAQHNGADGPVTFPLSTSWTGFYIGDSDDPNWFRAMGGIEYAIVGQVTVYPPSTEGGDWTYQSETSFVLRDEYNWDADKSTNILGLEVSDDELARLHRAGLAQEFTMTGESMRMTREGP